MVPDPLPLAYAVYVFINVDNCERPLTMSTILLFNVNMRADSLVVHLYTGHGLIASIADNLQLH